MLQQSVQANTTCSKMWTVTWIPAWQKPGAVLQKSSSKSYTNSNIQHCWTKRECLPKWKHKARRKHLGHQVSPEISDSALHNHLHICIEFPLLPTETFPEIECFTIIRACAEQSDTKTICLRVCIKAWIWRGQVRFVIMIFKLSFRWFLI